MNFAKLNPNHINYFANFLPQVAIKHLTPTSFENNDQTTNLKGNSKLCLRPSKTQEISKILEFCNQENLSVCIQGGNSGLCGGSVPVNDEIVLNLSRMDQIEKFDQGKEILNCEAGCIMQNVQDYIKPFGYELPWDLGAKQQAQIGGNLATHVGGLTFIRHGPMRAYITGIEVVLANGEILNLLSEQRKDNSGLDLKQLFINSEGLLGVISKCNIVCRRRKKHNLLIVLKCDEFKQILNIREISRKVFGSEISALEFMDSQTMDNILTFIPDTKNPFNTKQSQKDYYLLLQIGTEYKLGNELLENFSQEITKNCKNIDYIIANEEKDQQKLWHIRENASNASKLRGKCVTCDISIPLELMNSLAQEVNNIVKDYAYVSSYGHIGDGNMHLNISLKNSDNYELVKEKSTKLIYEYCRDVKGSISAEHGIGSFKKQFLNYTKSENAIDKMKKIKQLFDPKGILNPYKVLV